MERYPKKIQDAEISGALDHVFQNAFGLPILLSSAPANADLKANNWAKVGTDIYIKFGDNVTLKFSGSSVS